MFSKNLIQVNRNRAQKLLKLRPAALISALSSQQRTCLQFFCSKSLNQTVIYLHIRLTCINVTSLCLRIYNICLIPVGCRFCGPSPDEFLQWMTRMREKVHPVEDLVIGNIEACKHPNWLLCVLWVKACSVSHRHFEELFGYLHHVFHDNLWHAMVHYLISTKNIQSVRNQGKFICFWQFGWYIRFATFDCTVE